MMEEKEQFSAKVIKDSAIVSFGGWLTKFIGLGSTLTVIYFLSLYEYGVYKLVLAAFGLLSSFLFAGIDQIVIADAAVEVGRNNFGRVKRILVEYFIVKGLLALILWLVTFLGAGIIERFYSADIALFLRIISFLFLISPFKALAYFLFQLNLKFLNVSLISLIEEAAKLVFILFFFFVLGLGIEGVVLAYVLASFLGAAILSPFSFSCLRPLFGVTMSPEFVFSKIIKEHGKWGILMNYSMDIQRNIHPWLVKFFLGTEAVAIVSVAEGFFSHATSLFPFATVLIPTVPRKIDDRERLKRIFFRGIKYGTAIFIAVGIAAFFIAPYFIKFLFPKYLLSLPVFNILLISLLFTGMANVLTSLFYAFKMQKNLFFITIWRLIFMAALSVVLFPLLGLIGVAIQVVLTHAFFVLMRYRDMIKTAPEFSFNFVDLFKIDSYDREVLKKAKIILKSKFL